MIVFLDTNILGILCNRNALIYESQECKRWFDTLFARGVRFVTSDLCDYEVRRGLIGSSMRAGKIAPGIEVLNSLKTDGLIEFLPVSTLALDLAANLWAKASIDGRSTRDEKNIDIDIIISAQYQIMKDEFPGRRVVVATTNLKHLSLFCDAANWRDIRL
jgi:hypothetical protein